MKSGKIESLQPDYSLLNRSIEKDIVSYCKENKIGIIAYSPLASGLLTGKYDKNAKFSDWRGKGIIGCFSGSQFEKNMEKVARLKAMGKSMGKTCGQMAINWVVSQSHLTTALLGVKNEKQMEENIEALDWKLDPSSKKKLVVFFLLMSSTRNRGPVTLNSGDAVLILVCPKVFSYVSYAFDLFLLHE